MLVYDNVKAILNKIKEMGISKLVTSYIFRSSSVTNYWGYCYKEIGSSLKNYLEELY